MDRVKIMTLSVRGEILCRKTFFFKCVCHEFFLTLQSE